MFNFLKNDNFQNGYANLHSHQQYARVLVFLLLCQYLVLSFFLISAILTCVMWYFNMVLIYISLKTNDVDHLFMCLLDICVLCLVKCLFEYLPIFLNEVFLLILNCIHFFVLYMKVLYMKYNSHILFSNLWLSFSSS